MTGGLVLAAVAGALIPSARRMLQAGDTAPQTGITVAAGATAESEATS